MYVLIAAAAVLILAGVALLIVDARRRSANGLIDVSEQPESAPQPVAAGADASAELPAGAVDADVVDEEPEFVEPEFVESEPDFAEPEPELVEPVEAEAVEQDVAEPEVVEPVDADEFEAAWADDQPVELPEQLAVPEETDAEDAESEADAAAPEPEMEEVADEEDEFGGLGFHEHADFADDVDLESSEGGFGGSEPSEPADTEHDTESEPEPSDTEPEPEPEPAEPAEPKSVPHNVAQRPTNPLSGLLNLGNNLRKQRREWALANGFDFAKEDRFLSEEWARGAAASGHSTRDVVSGAVNGREIHIADLGETTVVAMRRGGASNVVMDARRPDSPVADDDADDLYEVGDAQGFTVYANDEEAIHRMFDERTDRALGTMPPEVTAVWAEGDWVLAQLVERTTPQAWESTFEPLAGLADCLRMLPPRSALTTHSDDQLRDPSRPRPFTIQDEEQSDPNHRGHLRAVPAVPDAVVSMEEEPVWRPAQPPFMAPTEPVELPSRSRGTTHGDVANIPNLGGPTTDGPQSPHLPAIGSDPDHTRASNTGGRIIRRLSTASTIFDDARPAEATPAEATPADASSAEATPNDPQKESADDPAADE